MSTGVQRDAEIFEHVFSLAVQDYEYLRYSNGKSLKEAFIAGEVVEPTLQYGDVDPLHVEECVEAVQALTEVVAQHEDEVVRRAYIPKLHELHDKYALLRASAVGDDHAAMAASTRLYGKPREDMFRFALRGARERVRRVAAELGSDPRVQSALEVVEPIVGVPDDERFPWDEVLFPAARIFTATRELRAAEIQERCTAAFARYGIEGWQAVVDAPGERVTFNTNHELRIVFIPNDEDVETRKYPMTEDRVEALIAHEIGTHVLRREKGAASPLALLGIGLAGYLPGEEGIATYVEQQMNGARHFSGTLGYLSVGWAAGLDGTPRTFRQLYEVLRPYTVISYLDHALAYGHAVDVGLFAKRAERRAWARCVRTFRGTSGDTAGACFTKDTVYLEGNIAIWELVSKDPSWVEKFSSGKYDPSNTEHVAILEAIGLL